MAPPDRSLILQALQTLPFPVGSALLLDVLTGEPSETVRRCRLDKERCFGSLSGHSAEEIEAELGSLLANGLVERASLTGKPYVRVLKMTKRGEQELKRPTVKKEIAIAPTAPSDDDRKLWQAFEFFLRPYTDEQKHAITAQSPKVLCIAGAGTGKTLVLTRRIEFLTRFQGVPKDKILAITFTRKARQEMQRRLHGLVQVETFNSFCEQLLQRHGDHIYGQPVRMVDYKDRARLLVHAIRRAGLDTDRVVKTYFTSRQIAEKTKDQLMRIFLQDIFGILDYYANNGEALQDFSTGGWDAAMVHRICTLVREEMVTEGLRDFSDQIPDAMRLLRAHPQLQPRYTHILVDEYQDVNTVQQQLLELLAPPHLFVVGDPRQSIFGWRGSRVRYILDFPADTTVVLSRNHRSAPPIVTLANAAIAPMRMPDLVAHSPLPCTLRAHLTRNEDEERERILQLVRDATCPREEIFVLTRTNRQLDALAQACAAHNIPCVTRSDEQRLAELMPGYVTLSTVHAIKGLEADMVIVAHCNAQSYPCIASDHPVLELVKRDTHDRDEEELRLLYVALTRARKELHVTCGGTPSRFLTREVRKCLGVAYDASLHETTQGAHAKVYDRLREWRTSLSRAQGIPPFLILPDSTLLALAQARPGNLEELQDIPGIGPVKARRYGDDLLRMLL